MSNRKISELTSLTAVAGDDVLPIVDISETSNATKNKKITVSELLRSAPDGTAAAPAFSFESDAGNGVFLAGTDTVGISTGGTQRVTVDGSGNVTISGDLTVSGATTTVESTTVTIDDKNIELGSVASPSNTTADGGGITLKGATDKTLKWINSTGCWTFNQPMNFNDHVRIDSSGRVGIGSSDPSPFGNNAKLVIQRAGSGESSSCVIYGASNASSLIQFSDGTGTAAERNAGFITVNHSDQSMRFGIQDSERLRIDSSGRLGIGTTSPSQKLQVTNGNIFLDGTDQFIYLSSDADQWLSANSASNYMRFGAANQERMRIDSSGRVGIGTTAPVGLLEIEGDASYDRSQGLIIQGGPSANTHALYGTLNDLVFDTASTERMRIDSSGRVGIGTSSPLSGANLTVAGNALAITGQNTAHSANSIRIGEEGSGLAEIRCYGPNSSTNGSLRLRSSRSDGSNNQDITIDSSGRVGINITTFSDAATALAIKNGASGSEHTYLDIVCDTNETTRVRFSEDGSTFPGEIRYNTFGHDMTFHANSAERMRIDSSGRVGIGTSSPLEKLEVRDGHISVGSSTNTTSTNTLVAGYGYIIGSTKYGNVSIRSSYVNTSNVASLEFYTAAPAVSERMRIDTSGNVGIGTSSPGALLHLKGNNAELRLEESTEYCGIKTDGSGNLNLHSDGGNTGSNSVITFNVDNTERMRIGQDGTSQIFSSSTTNTFLSRNQSSAGTTYACFIGQHSSSGMGTGTTSFHVGTNGNVRNSNNSYGSLSDIKLKENIVDCGSQWDDIKDIRVRKYNFKASTNHETFTQLGVIAQEVETVSPGLVTDSPDLDGEGNDLGTITKSVNYSVLYMKAVKALQEAMERIETLEAKVAALEAQ